MPTVFEAPARPKISPQIYDAAAAITSERLENRIPSEELITCFDSDAIDFAINLRTHTAHCIDASDVSILDRMNETIDSLVAKAQIAWLKEFAIEPQLAVGDEVEIIHPRTKVLANGVVSEINHNNRLSIIHPATYSVRFPKDNELSSWLLQYEEVEAQIFSVPLSNPV
jgi:hypothetical protein